MDIPSYLLGKKASGGSSGGRDWSAIGYSKEPQVIQDGYDYAIQIKNNWITNTSYDSLFKNNNELVFMPLVDTSTATRFTSMFQQCDTLSYIPSLNTSNGTSFYCFVTNCKALVTIDKLDMSASINVYHMTTGCSALTNLKGFLNIGQAYLTTASSNLNVYAIDLSSSPLLTHDSLMNVINNLYDIATAGVQTQQLILGSTNLAKLTEEEIAIATDKGWTVS